MAYEPTPQRIKIYSNFYISGALFANVFVFYLAWYLYFTSKSYHVPYRYYDCDEIVHFDVYRKD